MSAPLSIQLYSLGQAPSDDLDGVISRLAVLGYLGVEPVIATGASDQIREFAKNMGADDLPPAIDATALKRALDDHGMVAPSSHVQLPDGEHANAILDEQELLAHLPSLASEHVFTHGDFNPSNVLWHRGRISGVVDWSAARLDARWSEVAYCRGEVCFLLGPDLADRLADAYSDIVGYGSDELAVYDLMSVSSRHYDAESFEAYRQQGHTPDYEVSLAHRDEQLRRALRRLDW